MTNRGSWRVSDGGVDRGAIDKAPAGKGAVEEADEG